MNKLTPSRGTEIDTELCVKNAGNDRYMLIIMAAARAKQIARQHRASENPAHIYPVISALMEFQTGELSIDSARKIK
jgi:DNA-directed RNA polymerase subunit K/omega